MQALLNLFQECEKMILNFTRWDDLLFFCANIRAGMASDNYALERQNTYASAIFFKINLIWNFNTSEEKKGKKARQHSFWSFLMTNNFFPFHPQFGKL